MVRTMKKSKEGGREEVVIVVLNGGLVGVGVGTGSYCGVMYS